MFSVYFTIACILSGLGVVITFISFLYNAEENSREPTSLYFRWAAMILSGFLVVAWLWPVILGLAVPGFVGYGVFSWARAIRHKSLDF